MDGSGIGVHYPQLPFHNVQNTSSLRKRTFRHTWLIFEVNKAVERIGERPGMMLPYPSSTDSDMKVRFTYGSLSV